MSRRGVKLNRALDPQRFKVTVSTKCRLILDDYAGECRTDCPHRSEGNEACMKCRLRAYLESLGVYPCKDSEGHCKCCYTLRGSDAIQHARRVHAKIRRQLLRYEDVNAVDVGFAVKESEKRFENLLAIRIHVGRKQPVDALRRKGHPSFTTVVTPSFRGRGDGERGPGWPGPSWYYPLSGVGRSDISFVPALPPGAATEAGGRGSGCCDDQPRKEKSGDGDDPSRHCHCCECCGRCCYHICDRCRHCCYCCACPHQEAAGDEGSAEKTGRKKGGPADDHHHHHYCCGPKCRRCKGHEGPECGWCRLAICGVPIDIIEANYFPAVRYPGGESGEGVFVDPLSSSNRIQDDELLLTGRGRISPLVGGVSVGSRDRVAGTLSTVVWDETDGSPCVLGNWHVLAGTAAEAGQPCYQPAPFDGGGGPDDVVGHLKRWHLGDLGDAAIAELDGSRHFASGEVLGLWHPVSGCQPPELNLEIRKWGRTTGFTEGFVDGIGLSTSIDYGNNLIRRFEDQFHIAPLYPGQNVSQTGDSGALVVTSYDLDDLEVIARGMLRKEPSELKKHLKDLVGCDKIDDVEELASKVRQLLDCYRRRCCEDREVARGSGQDGLAGDSQGGPGLVTGYPSPAGSGCVSELLEECRRRITGCCPPCPESPEADPVPEAKASQAAANKLSDFEALLCSLLEQYGIDVDKFLSEKKDKKNRRARNVYYAVGMIFAGDTPGSPFGEFALASDVGRLAKDLRFSLRPTFEPRSSFRKLRSRPPGRGGYGQGRIGTARVPGGLGSDPRGQGPQPDPEPAQSSTGGTTGGG